MIEVIGKPACSQCEQAKMLLKMKSIEFTYKDVSKDEVALDKAIGSGVKSFPVIFDGDTLIGTLDDLCEWLDEF